MSSGISIIILTFNSASTISRTLRSIQSLSDDIQVVDSYSSDSTVALCEDFGCHIVQHKFSDYASQRNWAIDNLSLKYSWQLHVDADEEFTIELINKIKSIDLKTSKYDGYILGRKMIFMGKLLKYGAISKTWHYRLFRSGFGRCEDRLYDQHFVNFGKIQQIDAFMLDHQENSLSEWTARHNRWSDMEAKEIIGGLEKKAGAAINPNWIGSSIERKRSLKARYYQLPLFLRSSFYFFYSYIFKLGFLDGKRGFVFNFLQSYWFRVLVDAKIFETQLTMKRNDSNRSKEG